MTTPLRQTGRTDTMDLTFDVVHDPDDDTRYDVKWVNNELHKPVRVTAHWLRNTGDYPSWTLAAVKVTTLLRCRKGENHSGHASWISYSGLGTRHDDLHLIPTWLREALDAHTPADELTAHIIKAEHDRIQQLLHERIDAVTYGTNRNQALGYKQGLADAVGLIRYADPVPHGGRAQ
jgi:hypothetical protein